MKRKAAVGWSIGIIGFFAVVAAILLPMFLFGNKIVINYYINGKETTQVFDGEAKLSDVKTPKTEEGYYFDGWYADSNLTVFYETNTVFKKSTTIYPKISPKDYYTIFYFANNKSNDVLVSYELFNATIFTQPNPWSTIGYNFVGWSEDKDAVSTDEEKIIGENEVVQMESQAKKLYAVWEEKNIEIEYSVSDMLINGVQADFDNLEVKYGDTVTLPNCLNVTNKDDDSLIFGGFLVDGVLYKNGASFTSCTSEDVITISPYWISSDAYLYLNIKNPKTQKIEQYVFNVNQYAVEQGGETSYIFNLSSIVDENNMTIADIVTQPYLQNYEFTEFNSEDVSYTANSTIETTSKTYIIDAVYRGKERKLELYNEENFVSEHYLHYGEMFDLPETEREELLFLGYSENGYTGDKPQYSGEIFVDFEEPITRLYADFKMSLINLNANGGFGYMNDLSVPAYSVYTFSSQEKQLQKEVFTRQYYSLDGWSENKNATSGSFSIHTLSRRITLYAVWKRNSVEIKFNTEYGAIVPESFSIDQGSYYTFTKEGFSKPGYYLIGFEYNNETYAAGESVFIEEDSTISPIWSENEIYFSGASVNSVELCDGENKKVGRLSAGDSFYLPNVSSDDREKILEDGTKVYFAGWSLNRNAKTPDYFSDYDTEIFNRALIFYAIYMPETEELLYHGYITIPDNLNAEVVVIPNMHNGVEITSCSLQSTNQNVKYLIIGNNISFSGAKKLPNLKYAAVGKSLNQNMFDSCENLEAVSMANDIETTYMPNNIFNKCKKLTRVKIPETVTQIQNYAFNECVALNKVNMPKNLETIGSYGFSNCGLVGELVLPESLTNLSYNAFKDCKKLTKVTILGKNATMDSTSSEVFSGCVGVTHLKTATLNNLSISKCFENIQNVELLEGVTSIPNSEFEGLSYVLAEELVLPSTVTSIGSSAFENCDSLTKITLPYGLKSIAKRAFAECVSVSEVTIPSTVTNIENSAFYNCYSVTMLKTGYLQKYASSSSFISKFVNLTNVELLEGITAIPDNAFEFCYDLTDVKIANSVTSIGQQAFYNCTNLKNIVLSQNTESIGNYAFYNCDSLEELDLSCPVTSMGYYSFSNCDSLKSINFSDEFKRLGNHTFSECNSLTEITIPATITNMGSDVFFGCSSITKVTFEEGVKEIGQDMFYNCVNLVDVIMPDTIEKIEIQAFANCSGLTEINIPESVTVIMRAAFFNCDKLTSVVIPEGVITLAPAVFSSCDKLTSVVIPEGITSVPSSLCQNCVELANVSIPSSVTSIEEKAFSGCINLVGIDWPINLKSIGSYAFSDCTNITNCEISDGVKTIGEYAFQNCVSLKEVVVPASVTSVNTTSFIGCDNVTKLKTGYLSEGRYSTIISQRRASQFITQFENLKEVEVLEGVTSIGACTFYNCSKIKKITLPSTLTTIDTNAFLSTSFVKVFKNGSVGTSGYATYGPEDVAKFVEEDGVVYIKNSETDYVAVDLVDEEKTELVLNPNTTSIASYAFYGYSNLQKVVLPKALEQIETNAFNNCVNLTEIFNDSDLILKVGNTSFGYVAYYAESIHLGQENSDYVVLNGVMYFKNSDTNLTAVGLVDRTITNLVLDSRTTSIQSQAFYGNKNLLSITIPENVTSIESNAFYNCDNLYEVFNYSNLNIYLGNISFGYVAYYAKVVSKTSDNGCITKDNVLYRINSEDSWTALAVIDRTKTEVVLDEHTTSIAPECFKNSQIESLNIPDGLTSIGKYAFNNCSKLLEIDLSGVTTIGFYAFSGCKNLADVLLSEDLTIIEQNTFEGCSGLTEIVIPNSVTSIGNYAFSQCSGLKELSLSENLTSIGQYAFENCRSLGKLILPQNLTIINQRTFSGCNGLKILSLPENLTNIGYEAFKNCTGLKELVLPENLISMEKYAFSSCTALECVTLPSTVTTISQYAFSGCKKLATIYNYSALELTIGSAENGSVAYYATTIYQTQETDYVEINGVLYYKKSETEFIAVGLVDKTITDLKFDVRTTEIKAGAFENCENLISVTIPASIETVGVSAFAGCSNIRKLRTGYLGNNKNEFIKSFENLKEFELLEGLKSIPEYALNDANIFGKLIIPGTVTSIGSYAFQGCKNITEIVIPETVTNIGNSAFYGCEAMTEITIPSTVTSVGSSMFYLSGIKKIRTGFLPAGRETTNSTITRYASNLLSGLPTCFEVLELLDTVTEIKEFTFYNISKQFKIIFPSTFTKIDDYAFMQWKGSQEFVIPDTVTSIGKNAFYDCDNLKKLTLPNGLETIPEYMLYNCDNLTDVVMPDSLKVICRAAFSGCASLKQIELPEGLIEIKNEAFNYCSSLSCITVPLSITAIGSKYSSAFTGCENLKTVYNNSSLNITAGYSDCGGVAYYATNVYNCFVDSDEYVEIDGIRYHIASEDNYIAVGLVDQTKTSIVFDSRTKRISAYAFKNCVNLKEVTIPSSVSLIENNAFSGCDGVTLLRTGYLSDGYYTTANNDDSRCSDFIAQFKNLTRVEILDGISSIGIYTFYNCKTIKEVVFASSITTVGYGAFKGCDNLETVELNEGLTSLMYAVFSECISLKEVVLPSTVKKLGVLTNSSPLGVFGYCTSLTKVVLNEGLLNIESNTFSCCESLKEVNLPSSLISINSNAFSGCESLKEVTLPSSLVFIENNAFLDCKKLFTVYNNSNLNVKAGSMSHGGVAYYAKEVIKGEIENNNIEIDGVLYHKVSENNLVAYGLADETKTNVVLDSRTTEIAKGAFKNCSNILSITIPENVTVIGDNAFYECLNLFEIYNYSSIEIVVGSNKNGCIARYAKVIHTISEPTQLIEIDGVIYYKNSETDYIAVTLVDKTKTNVVLDARTTKIAYKAFYECDNLTKLTVPYGVQNIGDYAFYGCTGVEELKTGYLEQSLLSYFYNLRRLEILEGVEIIENNFLTNCGNLDEMILPKSLTIVGNTAFDYCSVKNLKTGYFSNSSTMKSLVRNVVTVEFVEGITEIGDICLYNAFSLENVVIPEGVTTIKANAFINCANLTSITLPSSLNIIEETAFYGCVRLAEIYNNSSLTLTAGSTDYGFVAYYAENIFQTTQESQFAEIDGVLYYKKSPTEYIAFALADKTKTNVVLDEYTTEINEYAFADCDSLVSVEMSNNVTKIGEGAFSGCHNLTNIVLSESINSLENNTFIDCCKLQEIILPNSITFIGDRVFANCRNLSEITMYSGVTHIGIGAFTACRSLTEIDLPDGAEILEYAFAECTNLTEVDLPNDIVVLCDGLFYYCINLTNIVIPETVEIIGKYVFANCTALTEIEIPNNVIAIGDYAFANDDELTRVEMSDSVTSLGVYAFENCKDLTDVTLSNNLVDIKNGVFRNCVSLEEIDLPDNISKIGSDAFKKCEKIYSINIPDSVTEIGESAFSNCRELTYLTMSNSVEIISQQAFYNCNKLIRINLPETLTSIGGDAFRDCNNLFEIYNYSDLTVQKGSSANGYVAYYAKVIHTVEEESLYVVINGIRYFKSSEESYIASGLEDKTKTTIEFDSHTTEISSYAFKDCANLVGELIIPGYIIYIDTYAFENCVGLTKLTCMDGVKSISSSAFRSCSGLTEVTIPNSVTSATYAFYYCDNVTKLTTGYLPEGEVGYWNTYTATQFIINFTNLKEVILLDGLTSIGNYTFYNIKSLEKITLSDTIETIGDSAFAYCSGLVSVVMTDYVSSIGKGAFTDCSNLEDINISRSITKINDSTFSGCSKLVEMTIPEGVTSIGIYAFSGCSGLESLTIPEGVTSIGDYAFNGCSGVKTLITSYLTAGNNNAAGEFILYFSNLERVELLENITTIPNYAFHNRKNLTTVVMTNSVTSIGNYAFSGCSNLSEISLSNSLTSIGQYAFYGCENLSEINLPDSITSIGQYAFSGCSNLSEINLPDSLTSIGQYAFYRSNLKEISIPEGVTIIQNNTFYDCKNLREVKLPSTLTTIASSSFSNCSSLYTITIPQNVTTIESNAFANCYKLIEIYNYSTLNFTIASTDYGNIAYYAKVIHTTEEDSALETIDGITYLKISDDEYMVFELADKTKTSITFDSRTKSIFQYAFYGCDNLMGTLQLPEGIVEIPQYAFYGCTGLIEVIIPESVKTIGQYAFYKCTNLSTINFPSGLRIIGKYAFYECAIGGEIIVSKTMSVGQCAFAACKNITDVTIGDISMIYSDSFSGCPIRALKLGGSGYYNEIDWVVSSKISQFSKATILEISYGVTKIDELALRSMVNLKKIILPTSLKEVDKHAFSYCSNPTFYINSYSENSVAGIMGYKYNSYNVSGCWHYDEDGRTPILWS